MRGAWCAVVSHSKLRAGLGSNDGGWVRSPATPRTQQLKDRHMGIQDKYKALDANMKAKAEKLQGNIVESYTAKAIPIAEDGRNGTIEFKEGHLRRTIKNGIRKDDVQLIPFKSISSVSSDKRQIHVMTSGKVYEWKVKRPYAPATLAEALLLQIM